MGGSVLGKRRNIGCPFDEAFMNIRRDYFGIEGRPPLYDEEMFRRRFRMRSRLFNRIFEAVIDWDQKQDKPSFARRRNAAGKWGAYPLQKIVAALRYLAYGCSADSLDEYVKLSETVILESMKKLCEAIVSEFQGVYLRDMTQDDAERLLKENAKPE